MEIHIRAIGQVVVVSVAGDIDGRTAPQARDEVAAQVPQGASILLDMSGVAYMSSAGLRMLLATYRQVKGSGINTGPNRTEPVEFCHSIPCFWFVAVGVGRQTH